MATATNPPPGNNLPTGIVRTPRGFRAFVRVAPGPGGLKSKCFKPGTGLLTMRRWREEQRVRKNIGADLPEAGRTLREDVAAYLRQVQTMPTIRHRRDDLALWLRAFGPERVRASITSGDIRAQLENWRAEGYAPSTVNHRRTALMHLWSVLDGKSAPNPARDVPRYRETLGPPRALSPIAVALLLHLMPDCQTRARLTLLAWTGWPPAQMAKLTPPDIDWDRAVFVRARRKGKGAEGRWLPLLPQAWAALADFKRLGCWGSFSTASARTSLRRAATKANAIMLPVAMHAELHDVTPYQFRHSFGTLVAGITQDDRAVQELLQHADLRQTHRYTGATVDPRVAAALARVSEHLERG
jgi:integrase